MYALGQYFGTKGHVDDEERADARESRNSGHGSEAGAEEALDWGAEQGCSRKRKRWSKTNHDFVQAAISTNDEQTWEAKDCWRRSEKETKNK